MQQYVAVGDEGIGYRAELEFTMQKRVALFIGSLLADYQARVCDAISSNIKGRFNLDIFTNLGEYGENFLHNEGEANIINLPDLADYAGIIVAPDSLSLEGLYQELLHKIETEAACPVISLRYRDEHFYNILSDDSDAMAETVYHFVNVHGCRRIAFMTGRLDLEDARRRRDSYYRAMSECGLPVTEHMVFEGNYWRDKGDEAVEWFLADEGGLPEAIVCSNDYMALSVISALQKRGIRIPEDVRVSGFDNIEEARYADPRLASMDTSVERMGEEAVELMVRLLSGMRCEQDVYVRVLPHYEGSCGCPVTTHVNTYRTLYEQNLSLIDAIMQNTYMSSDYEGCMNLEELMSVAFRYSSNIVYDDIYFCLCDHSADNGDEELEAVEQYTKDMIMYCSFSHRDGRIRMDGSRFQRRDILPAQYRRDNDTLYMLPLHYKNECLGYMVVRTSNPGRLHRYFLLWMQSLAAGIDKIAVLERNKLYQRFREESLLDSMTGLYNRRAFENILRRCRYERNSAQIYIMSIDMDGLKRINDSYGHAEGDTAICALAQVLKTVTSVQTAKDSVTAGQTAKDSVASGQAAKDSLTSGQMTEEHAATEPEKANRMTAARIGGDEFSIIITTCDETEPERIRQAIYDGTDEYNRTAGKSYTLSASIGIARLKGNGISRCLREADMRMYEEKADRKNSRGAMEE